jgi:hypothetical protein
MAGFAPKEQNINGVIYKNSQIPADKLIAFKSYKFFDVAADSLKRATDEAVKQGLAFRITSGYRPGGAPGDLKTYLKNGKQGSTQWAVWEGWNNGKDGEVTYDGITYPIGPAGGFNLASDPTKGFKSNHGFGIAVDIYGSGTSDKDVKVWTKSNPLGIGVPYISGNVEKISQDKFQDWFVTNGQKYGWIWGGRKLNPIEPWHFEYDYTKDTFLGQPSGAPLVAEKPQLNAKPPVKPQQQNKVNYLKSPSQQNQATSITQEIQDLGTSIVNTFSNLFNF